MRKVKTVVIGAGSAGLSALDKVKEYTDDFLLVHEGPYGTTCARTGCMPSKVLIQAAKDFHRREVMAAEGISGTEGLTADSAAVMRYVRKLRDRFAGGMRQVTEQAAGDRFINQRAHILSPHRIRVGDEEIETENLIIATGSSPIVPSAWDIPPEKLLTSRNIFEQEELPRRIAVVGLGVIGLELGQALARLGHEVAGFDMKPAIGGLADPRVSEAAVRAVEKEFPLHLNVPAEVSREGDAMVVQSGETRFEADAVVVALGNAPNLKGMGMENLGVDLDKRGVPSFDETTMQVGDLPVYLAGDAAMYRPLLHEAKDDGFIAGFNSGRDSASCFCRRAPLRIVFSDPQIAAVGTPFDSLDPEKTITAEVDFSRQARAVVEGRNRGLMRLYADKETGRFLGSEMAVPEAEHLAHQLAWAVQQGLTVRDLLAFPVYHPVVEEGLHQGRNALAQKLPASAQPGEISLCGSCPEEPLN